MARRHHHRIGARRARVAVGALVVALVLAPWPRSTTPARAAAVTAAPAAPGPTTTATSMASSQPPPPAPTSPATTGSGPAPTSTTATVPPASVPPTGTPGPAGDGPGGVDDPGTDVDDPLTGEGPAEEAPGVDVTIPPPETYGGQGPYRPPEILWSSVAEAERKLERSRQDKRDAVAEIRALRLRAKHLGLQLEDLDDETRAAIAELEAATVRYRGRAVTDYRLFAASVGPAPAWSVGPAGLDEAMERRRGARLAAAALVIGEEDIGRLAELRQRLSGETRELVESLRLVADFLVEAERDVATADEAIRQAEIEYEAFRAGSEVFIDGVLFPLGGPYDRPLIDSFGFPRMPGTPDEHWHEGIDLFAPRGTPLVATERGLVTRIGVGRLGGLKLWLVGESGTEWYYAHLDSFAPGLADGQLVAAGDLLGFVGTTGNAVGTPPHLHLQMHPGGGRPVNPYPLLSIVSDLDQATIAAGDHPSWRHRPVVVDRPDEAADTAADPAPGG
jgi:murein DD-endopeptidase MepM/ murein hydrolase activator NlpD